jgi:hypothetical protein
MMNIPTRRAFRRCGFALVFSLLVLNGVGAWAGDLKLEAQLVWGTNDKKATNPNVKPVEADVRQKLAELPLRWTNYFEINRKQFDVPRGKSGRAALSEKCAVEVKSLEGKKVEVVWYNKKGDLVGKQSQPMGKGEMIVLGGNAPNSTCWLVTLKRLE